MKIWEKNGIIDHEGIVQTIDSKSVTVLITASPACSTCNIETSCSLSGAIKKSITVHGNYIVKPGDSVKVLMKQSLGFAAVFLGYLLPFLIVFMTLLVLNALKFNELLAGVFSLLTLLPYYILLYIFRKNIYKKFTLTIEA